MSHVFNMDVVFEGENLIHKTVIASGMAAMKRKQLECVLQLDTKEIYFRFSYQNNSIFGEKMFGDFEPALKAFNSFKL